MKKVTEVTIQAFLSGQAKKVGNTFSDGKSYFLFNNKIAEHREDGLYISNAGWFSKTTKERLNGFPNVRIHQAKKKWYLNGNEWDGSFTKINDNPPPAIDEEKVGSLFNESTTYVQTDGWRGYSQPTYAVCGANDTGMWGDSPCPSNVCESELNGAKNALKRDKIPSKVMTTETSNVFCAKRYLIVPPKYIEKAKEILNNYINEVETRLLYVVS